MWSWRWGGDGASPGFQPLSPRLLLAGFSRGQQEPHTEGGPSPRSLCPHKFLPAPGSSPWSQPIRSSAVLCRGHHGQALRCWGLCLCGSGSSGSVGAMPALDCGISAGLVRALSECDRSQNAPFIPTHAVAGTDLKWWRGEVFLPNSLAALPSPPTPPCRGLHPTPDLL